MRLMDYCFYELKKHIVMVFHAVEEKDGDNTRLRIKVEGQTKNNVWEPMDLGGFMEMHGNDRVIGFSNCERYFAKGTRGIKGVMKVPELGPDKPNDFLTRLFDQYYKQAADEVRMAEEQKRAYEAVMEKGQAIIAKIEDANTANQAVEEMKQLEHVLTSRQELAYLFSQKVAELNLVLDKETKQYVEG